MGHPRPLFRLFSVFFKQTIQSLQQLNVKKCHVHPATGAGIRTHDQIDTSLPFVSKGSVFIRTRAFISTSSSYVPNTFVYLRIYLPLNVCLLFCHVFLCLLPLSVLFSWIFCATISPNLVYLSLTQDQSQLDSYKYYLFSRRNFSKRWTLDFWYCIQPYNNNSFL